MKKLLDEQKAYYCFDTAEELQARREEAEAQKRGFVYRRPERFPDDKDVEKAKAEGKPVTVRFAVPEKGTVVVCDVVRGEVSFDSGEIGDFIIQKSDGFPTYNFACVVDDYLMKVTHVIRGQEHLMNTPGQQLLWEALGFGELPNYVHMSVTVSEGGGKLSKRERPKALRKAIKSMGGADLKALAEAGGTTVEEVKDFVEGKATPDMPIVDSMAKYAGVELPEINVVDFFRSGYLPETMVNFLSLLGWNPGDKREIMTVGELTEAFDLTRLTKSNSLFDRDKLIAFNTEHIKMIEGERLLEHFKDYLKAVESPLVSADDELLSKMIKACEGARTLADVERKSRFVVLADERIEYDEKAVKKVLLKGGGVDALRAVREKLSGMEEFTNTAIEDMLRGLAEERGVGLGKVAQPLRVAICGTTISLPIFESVEMLGKENTLRRVDNTIGKFETRAEI